jgi:hypothetical protein
MPTVMKILALNAHFAAKGVLRYTHTKKKRD